MDRREWARVVVPLDTSRTAEAVVPWAALMARDRGMSVHLVTVWDEEAPIPGESGDRPGDDVEAELRSYLDCVAARPEFAGVPVAVEVRAGDVIEEICATVEHRGDLVILASHGQGGYVESRLGSVAERLIRSLHNPVLVIPAEAGVAVG